MENKDKINKDATVGNKPKIFMLNPPGPNNKNYVRATIAPSERVKRKPCSGCSRKRSNG